MARSFYSCAIFFTGLNLLLALFWNIVIYQLGEQIYGLPILAGFHIFIFLIGLISSLLLLMYYHYRQYWFAFWVAAVSIAPGIFQFFMVHRSLATAETSFFYFIATYLVLGMGILHGISLVFSEAGRRSWLRAAGIFSIILGFSTVATLIWAMSNIDARLNGTTAEIGKWLSIAGSLGLIFFIQNFRTEKASAEEGITSVQKNLVGVLNVAGFVALITTFILGAKVAQTATWISNHPEHVPEYLATIAEPYEARTYRDSRGDSLQYRLMLPLEYDSSKKYPVVVSLHGSGGRGTDNARQLVVSVFPHILSKPENRKKYPAFILVPQCPPKSWWGGVSGFPGKDTILIESILALEKEFSIDTKRRYLEGISMGGYGTWHLISSWPRMFAAAVPIAGEGDPALAPNVVDVPIWAFHGAKDGNVPVSGSRDMIEAIKKAGGKPRYTEYPEEGHNIGVQIMNTPELLEWLFAQEQD